MFQHVHYGLKWLRAQLWDSKCSPLVLASPSEIVLRNDSLTNPVDRQRSLDQLVRMADGGDEMAAVAVTALAGLVIQP